MVNVLFLCTGNSARSIIAEGLLNTRGQARFRAFSAGSHPRGAVNPLAIETLKAHGIGTEGFRSKSWDEFAAPGAPALDVIITVCDSAAREECPIWPGHPATLHWSLEDPAGVEGPAELKRRAFAKTYDDLDARIGQFIASYLAK